MSETIEQAIGGKVTPPIESAQISSSAIEHKRLKALGFGKGSVSVDTAILI